MSECEVCGVETDDISKCTFCDAPVCDDCRQLDAHTQCWIPDPTEVTEAQEKPTEIYVITYWDDGAEYLSGIAFTDEDKARTYTKRQGGHCYAPVTLDPQ